MLIQETHCENEQSQNDWKTDWKGKSFWSHGTNLSKGVAFLIHEQATFKVVDYEVFVTGRLISLKVEINDQKLQILNIYAPNNSSERKRFIKGLSEHLDDLYLPIFAGDFNCALDGNIDRKPSNNNRDPGVSELVEIMLNFNLEDIYRKRFLTKQSFTFTRGSSKSRIDYFLTSCLLDSTINNTSILHFPFSDHDAIRIDIDVLQCKRGPGIWKMNTKTMFSKSFRESLEKLWPIWSNDINSYQNPIAWWEIIKYKIKQLTIEISKSLNVSKHKIIQIEKRLNEIKDSDDNKLKREFEYLKQKTKQYYENQLEAAKVRSRIKCYEEGEKSSKYFFNTEKKNASDKIWTKIKCRDGSYSANIYEILNEQKHFYKSLFTSEDTDEREAHALLNNVDQALNEDEKLMCDSEITEQEIFDIIKLLKTNKSPGDDGIVSEFYKEYWYLISEKFTEVLRYIFNANTLSKSQYNAVLTLLYKKGEREDIRNWRPISLLNVDYKIITKLLAERLKKVLPSIIHNDQKGFVKGRNINDANRLLQDLIFYSDKQEFNSAIIFLDYEKAFDRVEWSWVLKCLSQFNFGGKFISWIDMVFRDAKTSILTNGYRSSYFKISRSMRQGCPVSPLLFILQAAQYGIPLPISDPQANEETEDSIVECFKILDSFEKSSGAKVNKTKTYGLYTGPWRDKIPEFKEIKWTKNNVKTLGIHHGYNIDEAAIWLEKINKIKNCIQVWKTRDLTYVGKVLVIKTLILSQIGFLAESLNVPNLVVKEIESLLWYFLWDGKQPLVSRNTMYLDKDEGGVNMPNLRNILISKRVKLIYKILNADSENWNLIGKHWLRKFDHQYNDEFFLCKCSNLKGLDISDLPDFYQSAINSWATFQGKMKVGDKNSVLNSNLFGNINICCRSTPLFYPNFSNCNIKTVRDIWDCNTDSFHKEAHIYNMLTDKTNWRQKYNKVKNSIPVRWINILKENLSENISTQFSITPGLLIYSHGKYIQPNKLKQKTVHKFLLDESFMPKSQIKWETIFNRDFNWKLIWSASLEIPCSNKAKQFQWKIIHNTIFTEHKLQLMNFSDGLCHFCQDETEDVRHLFVLCPFSKEINYRLENKMNDILNRELNCNITLQAHDILIGYLHSNKIISIFVNFVMHIAKWELWKIRNSIKHEKQRVSVNSAFDVIILKIVNATLFIEQTKTERKFRNIICLLKYFM